MRATQLTDVLFVHAEPLTSPFLALLVTLLLSGLRVRVKRPAVRVVAVAAATGAFWAAYLLLGRSPQALRWLRTFNTPLVAVYLVLVLPAVALHGGRWYPYFLALPALLVVLAVAAAVDAYGTVPPGEEGFYWVLIRPPYLMAGVVSVLLLLQPWLKLERFRKAVRLAALVVLLYGGFALRSSYADYQGMLQRRREAQGSVMRIMETSPVVRGDRAMLYVPSAPCRFSADGGYVQGCNLEMLQRIMQVNLAGVAGGDPAEVGLLAILLGGATLLLVLSFVAGRWFCGWVCPLSTLGGIADAARRRLGLPHVKPARPVKLAYLFSGIGASGVALAMAKAYPHLDERGTFLGCSIPLYPFCKICPGQQLCPVAAQGPAGYGGLPTWDWGFGFFRVAAAALLVVFVVSFAAGRRVWCRLCPMGMVSGLFNRGGMSRLRKNALKCNRCGACADVCPMDIDAVRSDMDHGDVTGYDCVLCLKCVAKCPRDDCLAFEHSGMEVVASRYEGPR